MNKLKLYLETSIWNYYRGQGSDSEQEATRRLLAAARDGEYEIFVSALVMQELMRTPDAVRRQELMRAVSEYQPAELEVEAEAKRLMDEYIAHRIVSEKMRNDAAHAAIATLAQMDVVVSWNLKHLVNPRTRRMVNGINNMLGYGRIDFGTPEEVIAYEP